MREPLKAEGTDESNGQDNVADWLKQVKQSTLVTATATAETPDSCMNTNKRQHDDEGELVLEAPMKHFLEDSTNHGQAPAILLSPRSLRIFLGDVRHRLALIAKYIY
ncbi:MAG: hypothetical protein LQ338_007106 [Usnochroma carphineum]|nr:MAG: hypothetical protein LQ338_007106 [Usnochroma carphineum]